MMTADLLYIIQYKTGSLPVRGNITTGKPPTNPSQQPDAISLLIEPELIKPDNVSPPLLMDTAAHMARNFKVKAAMRFARLIGKRH